MACCWLRLSSCCHRSWFFTGLPSLVRQLRRFQPGNHSLMPFCTYCESVWTSTVEGRFSNSSARITAVISMRLLVVSRSPPQISLRWPSVTSKAPQPPTPGLPLQAPSL